MSQEKMARLQLEALQEMKEVFGTESGQRVLGALAMKYKVFDSVFSEDIARMALMEGQRCVVLDIINSLDVDVKQLQKLVGEMNVRRSDATAE
jgi:hypothetical protein